MIQHGTHFERMAWAAMQIEAATDDETFLTHAEMVDLFGPKWARQASVLVCTGSQSVVLSMRMACSRAARPACRCRSTERSRLRTAAPRGRRNWNALPFLARCACGGSRRAEREHIRPSSARAACTPRYERGASPGGPGHPPGAQAHWPAPGGVLLRRGGPITCEFSICRGVRSHENPDPSRIPESVGLRVEMRGSGALLGFASELGGVTRLMSYRLYHRRFFRMEISASP
jgi:hypothetical protein